VVATLKRAVPRYPGLYEYVWRGFDKKSSSLFASIVVEVRVIVGRRRIIFVVACSLLILLLE